MATGKEENCKEVKPEVLKALMAAYEEYSQNGVSTVLCPKCSEIIEFRPVSETVLKAACPCGLIKDTLKGL